MDDRELEARLRTHLHRTLDGLDAPRHLRSGVEFAIRTPTQPIPAAGVRFRPSLRVGFSIVAAAAILATVALVLGAPRGPASGPAPSPSPSTIGPSTRIFIVLPPGAAIPTKADSAVAGDVLAARLRALGFGTFTSTADLGLTFELPTDGPSDDVVRATLGATGDVALVPLPPTDFGTLQGPGRLSATVGQPLPEQLPVLVGGDGIAGVAFGSTSPGVPSPLDITLTSAASQVLATWSSKHVGEFIAVTVDSKVVVAPTVHEAITDGVMVIDAGGDTPPFLGEGVAVMIGGPLPESWRLSTVVEPISRDAAIAAAQSQGPGDVQSADLSVESSTGVARAVWTVVLRGAFPVHCAVPVGSSDCGGHHFAKVTIDAIGANVLSFEFLDQ